MNQISPGPGPRRVGPVEPDLLGSAIFLYSEYLHALEDEAALAEDDDEEEPEPPQIDMRAILDMLAEELGTEVTTTLNLYMRLTALHRLLAANPTLARLALDEEGASGFLTEEALIAAARLDLIVRGVDDERRADFDPAEFREALEDLDED